MLDPVSQLILRNGDRLPAGKLLVVNPPADDLPRELAARDDLQLHWFTQDRADAQALAAQGVAVEFGAAPAGNETYAAVLLLHPKERALAEFLLFLARSRVAAGGSLWLAGENKGGIRGTEKRLAEAGIQVETIDSARHCRLVKVSPKSAGTPFSLEDWLEVTALDIGSGTLAVASLPGVFSAGRLDDGTALLLGTLDSVRAGRVLDMGCGAGVIGAWLKKNNPALTVDLADSNALAVTASEWTLRENGLDARVFASDGFSAVSGTYDWIVSNPPFHNGIATDYRFVERFIADAPRFLRPGGRLRIVANAHLKYLPAIQRAFGNARTLTENSRFRIYEAVRS
ncbi:MAG: methyltransferase [Pseudomonadota bacterium]